MIDHTFVICAYGQSPYLATCIQSLQRQEMASPIIMVTSTENDYIHRLAYQYGIPLFCHEEGGLGKDWNFGLRCAQTGFVTLAHQDDVYLKHYLSQLMTLFLNHPEGLIAFSDYGEIRSGQFVAPNVNLKIKKMMLAAMAVHPSGKPLRRRILGFGNPICCPSVTYNRNKTGDIAFEETMKTNADWAMWDKLSRMDGEFLYCPEILMGHRIHSESATSDTIDSHVRSQEDLQMLSAFWPKPVAKVIEAVYKKSEEAN